MRCLRPHQKESAQRELACQEGSQVTRMRNEEQQAPSSATSHSSHCLEHKADVSISKFPILLGDSCCTLEQSASHDFNLLQLQQASEGVHTCTPRSVEAEVRESRV